MERVFVRVYWIDPVHPFDCVYWLVYLCHPLYFELYALAFITSVLCDSVYGVTTPFIYYRRRRAHAVMILNMVWTFQS